MDPFDFSMPTRIVFGPGREDETGRLVLESGGSRALVLFGGGSARRTGLLARVERSLCEAQVEFVELGGVRSNPGSGLVYEGIRRCRAEGVDFVLAVGGGSVIDTAKAVAAGVCYPGDVWDFYEGGVAPLEALPVGVVLTIAASGSEASPDSVITRDETLLKRETSSRVLLPRFAVMDPELTETLPAYQTACGITDMLSHALERYLTNTREVETSDRLLEGLMLAIVAEAPRVMADPHDHEARANLMWAACLAHNDVAGVGRSQDWASHDIEYALSSRFGCAHGAGLAIVMPAVMSYTCGHDPERLAQLAVRVWGCESSAEGPEATAREGIARFRGFLASLGMPVTLGEIGAGTDDVEAMAYETCHAGGRTGRVGGFVSLGEKDVRRILELAL